jgi:shikimate kinase
MIDSSCLPAGRQKASTFFLLMGRKMIRKKIEVAESERFSVFGDKPERPACLENQAIVLVGLPGSKAPEVGRELARRLSCGFKEIVGMDREEVLVVELEALELEDVLDGGLVVAALPAGALRRDEVRRQLRRRARVFYLMASVSELLEERNGSQLEREHLAEEIRELEPLCMETMHFLLPAGRSTEEMVDDALDKAAL